jgi:DNA repair protein RecN (Recombination protein N)
MLSNLHVKNFAIIDEVEVCFSDHLNILTGETGAGKSIVIGSINIALGGKMSMDMVRKGEKYALVELVFQLEDDLIIEKLKNMDLLIEDGQVIISRRIMNGRSISKINGEHVTTAVIKEVASVLIDIHGQHEHQSLLYKNKHLDIVDRYAKSELELYKEDLLKAYNEYTKVKRQLAKEVVPEEERLREVSFMEYELKEIEEARIIPGEDEELNYQYKKLANSHAIAEGLSGIYEVIGENDNSVSDKVGRAVRTLHKLEEYDIEIEGISRQLSDIEGLVSDFNRELSGYMSGLNYDNTQLVEVENRLNILNSIKAKYGNNLYEVNNYYEGIIAKLQKYREYDQYILELEETLVKQEEILKDRCEKVSKIRKGKGKELSVKIKEALIDLNFLDVRFEVNLKKLKHYTENGYDEVEFVISTNPGEDLKPLAKVASGGELSRIMLAIKSVLADNDAIETLIFDEIDVGVSGRTAQKVSEKLSFIANKHQVICITHLPQIASMADEHYIIEKQSENNSTKTTIRLLSENQSIDEIARILGGAKITESVISSAKEMKELATNTKIY